MLSWMIYMKWTILNWRRLPLNSKCQQQKRANISPILYNISPLR